MRYKIKRINTVKDAPPPPEKRSAVILSHTHDILGVAVSAVSLALIIFTFFIRLGTVYGHSMQNTLSNGDIILFSPMIKNIEEGDIIVFDPSGDTFSEPLVKRVIATEGQTVYIDTETGIVSVDGVEISESEYVSAQADTVVKSFASPYTVESGHVFVLGDNRGNSIDSRHPEIGTVDLDSVIGKVVFRIYPFDSVGALS